MFPRRPISNIYKSFQNMGPEQIFRRFMDHSDKIHHELLQQEYRDSQKQLRESSEGLPKPTLLKAQADNQSKESPADGDISERDSESINVEAKGLGTELNDASIQQNDKKDRLSSAHTAGLRKLKSKELPKTRLTSAQSS